MEVYRTPSLDQEPKIDRTSPVSAVKSYWAIRDYESNIRPNFKHDTFFSSSYRNSLDAWWVRHIAEVKSMVRSIDKTEMQVDGRVVVFVTEPERSGCDLDQRKYIMLEEQGEWTIEDIFDVCTFCEGTGKVAGGIHFGEYCTDCDGSGWRGELSWTMPNKDR